MTWVSRLLRGDRVWVRASDSGAPQAGGDGRVDVVYRPGGKVYRASARNLEADPDPQSLDSLPTAEAAGAGADGAAPARAAARGKGGKGPGGVPRTNGPVGNAHSRPAPENPIIIYADGACSGNPGPCGIGVVILDGAARRELSEYLGIGTNNVGELTAIIRALEEVPRHRTVLLHSDSSYSLGLLGQGWKAKANQDLVARMRALAAEFPDLRLFKVAGHAGIPENERADALARDAVTRRK